MCEFPCFDLKSPNNLCCRAHKNKTDQDRYKQDNSEDEGNNNLHLHLAQELNFQTLRVSFFSGVTSSLRDAQLLSHSPTCPSFMIPFARRNAVLLRHAPSATLPLGPPALTSAAHLPRREEE